GVALKVNDSVTVESGNSIIISTQSDAIKTSNSDISSKSNQRGTVSIIGGHVDIYAAGDGISAAYNAEISQAEEATVVYIFTGSESSYTTSQPDSTKGIKVSNELIISGGSVNVTSADDGLHANANVELENGESSSGNITISGGTVTLDCADDGIHADGELTISDGTVNVNESHEGLEGNVINISGGTTYVYGDDDAVNASKGNSTPLINITGGYLEVETPQGDTDAVDSNGNITMTGGFVLVKGGAQMGGMAGSVDADGTVTVTGGTIIALGGVTSTPSSNSVATYITSSGTLSSGEYTLTDSSGSEIATFTLDGSYSFGWISSDQMTVGETYTLSCNGSEVLTWTQSSQIEGSAGNMGMGGMGGFGRGNMQGNMQGESGEMMQGGYGSRSM
ncbi:MAG: carbohydrate-binding domain-containing protein, partial [Clostridia bacterium]|nr:carbohydrate-binding domain-containing protein [Clostridia bacterium]